MQLSCGGRSEICAAVYGLHSRTFPLVILDCDSRPLVKRQKLSHARPGLGPPHGAGILSVVAQPRTASHYVVKAGRRQSGDGPPLRINPKGDGRRSVSATVATAPGDVGKSGESAGRSRPRPTVGALAVGPEVNPSEVCAESSTLFLSWAKTALD